MIYIGWGLIIFGLLRLSISLINGFSHPYLLSNFKPNRLISVSVLIPARNEENNIFMLLNDLVAVKFNQLEIIVYDDNSRDNTAKIVESFIDRFEHIKLIKGTGLEKGWLGKNYACHQLALEAKGEKILFLDADVRVDKQIIEKSLYFMEKNKLHLLSIFPTQIMPSLGSWIAIPIINWILLTLLPLSLVSLIKFSSLSAANGQFMLFDTKEYMKIYPHKLFRKSPVEDIIIAQEYKRRKKKIAVLLGKDDICCKMYSNLSQCINGFSKNIFQFFGGSIVITFFFAFITTIAPFYILFYNGLIHMILYVFIIILTRIVTSLISNQPIIRNLLLLVPQQFVFCLIIINAFIYKKNRNLKWKDRKVSSV